MSKRCMRKSERIEFRGNLWANTQYFLTKAASELWRIIHAHTHARVILYGHLCFFLSRFPTLQSPLTPFAWGRNSCVRSLRSRVWACFDYQNNSQHIHTAPLAQHLLLQMHSMSITPECYSGILVKNTPSFRKGLWVGYICRFLRFLFSLFSLYLPLFYRETSGRRPSELRLNSLSQKSAFYWLNLKKVDSITDI